MKTIRFCLLLSALILAASAGTASAGVTYTAFPQYPGGSLTSPCGIWGNEIVGTYTDSNNVKLGFLYDGTTWTSLQYPGATTMNVNGIWGNTIVGSYKDVGLTTHGFIYDGTTWTSIDWFPGGGITSPQGICGTRIVGSGVGGAFLYDSGTWTALQFPGATGMSATGIYGGNIVGSYGLGSSNYPFLFNGVTWTALPSYPGARRDHSRICHLGYHGRGALPDWGQ